MNSAFGIDHGDISKAAYYALPTKAGVKASVKRGLKAPKRPVRGNLKPLPDEARRDYIAPDGVQVRWRGGG